MVKEEKSNVFIDPNADIIFIERDPVVNETKGGLAIPETARKKPNMGTIKIVGPDCVKAKPGMRVFFGEGSGMDLAIGSFVYTMLREREIYAFHNLPPLKTGEAYSVKENLMDAIMKK
jgi:chaperonin GroES